MCGWRVTVLWMANLTLDFLQKKLSAVKVKPNHSGLSHGNSQSQKPVLTELEFYGLRLREQQSSNDSEPRSNHVPIEVAPQAKDGLREYDSKAMDKLTEYVHRLPPNSPYRKPIVAVVASAYPTQQAASARMQLSTTLISRAKSAHDGLQEVCSCFFIALNYFLHLGEVYSECEKASQFNNKAVRWGLWCHHWVCPYEQRDEAEYAEDDQRNLWKICHDPELESQAGQRLINQIF